jgi:hypothetical protein
MASSNIPRDRTEQPPVTFSFDLTRAIPTALGLGCILCWRLRRVCWWEWMTPSGPARQLTAAQTGSDV